jgi:site-specific recombinase XerD
MTFIAHPLLPLRACWRSSSLVTHGDIWLLSLVLLLTSYLPYLGRYRGGTRLHTESDLRVFLRWCADQDLAPLTAVRADIERYLRWLQDVRRYQPSTVSRRLSVRVGFYRVCVIDQILPHSPADYVRRPTVPVESPTLGLGHLQFEALIKPGHRPCTS